MKNKFNEDLNTAVFTSKYVISRKSPIVYIAHHDDGTWEFWGKEIINESEILVVSLREIIEIDNTVLEVSDLPYDFNAIREDKEKPWQIIAKN